MASQIEAIEGFTTGEIGDGRAMVSRALRGDERPYPALDADVPRVIEARRGESLGSLRAHLSRSSEDILRLIYRHGAVLLRGFPITSTHDFEETLFSVRALRAMRGYFMAEPGRVRVAGSTRIFHTNAFMRTGGTLHLGGFHSENYFSSDVPAFIAFCCHEEPWLGGETGIVHMARAYQELGDGLRARLEGEPSCAISWALSSIARVHGLDEAIIERVCREVGLSIATMNGETHVLLYKPNVLVHPVTGLPSLHLNVSSQIRDLDEHIKRALSPAYGGPKWALHRLGWRHPKLSGALNSLYRVLPDPKGLSVLLSEYVLQPFLAQRRAVGRPSDPMPPNACRRFDDEDVRSLAEAMARHTNIVTWRRGDVLILDNLQMLHTGMPGFGARRIEAALCNPLPIRWPLSSGTLRVDPEEGYETLFERFTALAEGPRSPASP